MTYFAAVYGAGLAGCAIANKLLDAGKSVLLIDPSLEINQDMTYRSQVADSSRSGHASSHISDPVPVLSTSTASDTEPDNPGLSASVRQTATPAALVNPAMGRYAKLSWEAEACYHAVLNRAHELTRFSGSENLFAETGVLRPAINTDLAENFRGALDAHDWPEGWITWIDADAAASRVPYLGKQHGALLLNKGFTVYLDRYLKTYHRYLEHKGAELQKEVASYRRLSGHIADISEQANNKKVTKRELLDDNDRWKSAAGSAHTSSDSVRDSHAKYSSPAHTSSDSDSGKAGKITRSDNASSDTPRFQVGEHLVAHIIVAAGSATLDFPEFEGVPLHRVKGQTATFEADHDLPWDTAISAMGYILREGKRGIIAGSTYEHNQNNTIPTEQAYQQIIHKLFSIVPELSGRIVKTGQWAGIRVTTPNKLPVIGAPAAHPGFHMYTALGSKGLLFSEHVAGILAGHILHDIPLPHDLDVNRFL
ncbi:MAG: FAD-binding oxidoreductase [Balneolales bacterium]|nr:FAD-binding oxidoreductase [Balneolales bacterium]